MTANQIGPFATPIVMEFCNDFDMPVSGARTAGIWRTEQTVRTMNTRLMPIPGEVVQALRAVDSELREDVIDPETMTLFVRAFGYDNAGAWLSTHPLLYFEALRRCREHA